MNSYLIFHIITHICIKIRNLAFLIANRYLLKMFARKRESRERYGVQISGEILYGLERLLPMMKRADFHRPVLNLEAG